MILVHFNICSLSENFENLETLISRNLVLELQPYQKHGILREKKKINQDIGGLPKLLSKQRILNK